MVDGEFPDDVETVVVDDVFERYDVLCHSDKTRVSVYCEHCDEIVATFAFNAVKDLSEEQLYRRILDEHYPSRDVQEM